jgi:hypothetical protein
MLFRPGDNPQAVPQRAKRCHYQCTCGNQWSVSFEVGDRKVKRNCFRCKQPCYPAATTYTVPSKRDIGRRP